MKFIGNRTLKSALTATFSIILALSLGLTNYSSSGIIGILSVQNTKRKSIQIALHRFFGFVISLVLASLLFTIIGFNAFAFGIYLLIFIPLCVNFKITEGIIVNAVLTTHFLSAKIISISLIFNETLLLIIGVGIALLFNLYMPSYEKKLQSQIEEIETLFSQILNSMAHALHQQESTLKNDYLLVDVEKKLARALETAIQNNNNYLLNNDTHYLTYLQMRQKQLHTLHRMKNHFKYFSNSYEQTQMISSFTYRIAQHITSYNSATQLLDELEDLRLICSTMKLPKSRQEFENRAMLFQFLNDLEDFLTIKNEYHHTKKQ